jgi:hypothetical protein
MKDEIGVLARGVPYFLLWFALCCLPVGVFAQAQPSVVSGHAEVVGRDAFAIGLRFHRVLRVRSAFQRGATMGDLARHGFVAGDRLLY